MPSWGNRSFQGLGLPPDLSRRLEDIARQVAANQSDVASLKTSAIDAPKAQSIATAAAQQAVSTTVLNISNATGTPAAAASGGGIISVGTHATRPAASTYATPTLYYETDRTVLYLAVSNLWVYVAGAMAAIQSAIPSGLGANDAGFLVDVTNYAHQLRWGGSAWGWAPGEPGSGFIQGFAVDPATGWHLCDGSSGVNYLKSDGTLGTITLPNLTGANSFAEFGPTFGSGTTLVPATGTSQGTVALRAWFRQ